MRRAYTSPEASYAVFAGLRSWRRLRFAILSIALLALAASGMGCTAAAQKDQAEQAVLAALPQEVREALDRAAEVYQGPLSGARWLQVHQLDGADHRIFQLQGRNGRGNKIELEATGAGRVIEVEEHGIPLSEVPIAVVEALKARMPHFEPTQVEAIYQVEKAQPVSYGFEGRDAAGKKIEIYISADGKSFLN